VLYSDLTFSFDHLESRMAGERKGKAHEAVVMVALEELWGAGVFSDPIYWEKTPKGMSIKPDITIGPSEDLPAISILVTHSRAAGNSHMKFWRNLGELVETKTYLANIPRVFSLTFGAIKEDLEPIQAWAFDEFRWSRGEGWHAELDTLTEELTQIKGLNPSCFPDEIRRRNPRSLLNPMKKLLRDCLCSPQRPQMTGLWDLHRRRPIPRAPSSRVSHVRRGLAKLLVFEDLELGAKIHEGQRVPKNKVPSYGFELGLVQKSTREAWGIDPEIQSVIQTLGRQRAIELARQSMQPQMEEWYYTLRNHALVPYLAQYIFQNYSDVCSPASLRKRLEELHDDPRALVQLPPQIAPMPPPTVWLFELLVQLIRASTGSANGYGYAQLGEEVIQRYSLRRPTGGVPRIWAGGFVLSDWAHRRRADQLTTRELEMIATVLSARIKEIGARRLSSLCSEMASANATHILEAKVIPYRMFDPIGVLLHSEIADFEEIRIDVCFREAAGIAGQAGRMVVGKAQKTLINWQSAHDTHTNDKKKELCGRGVGLRYHWNGSSFMRRPGVDKLILVLDGTWRDEDIQALVRAGWDEIYFPDEMDRIAKAVV
jgi:hypothetical protein